MRDYSLTRATNHGLLSIGVYYDPTVSSSAIALSVSMHLPLSASLIGSLLGLVAVAVYLFVCILLLSDSLESRTL